MQDQIKNLPKKYFQITDEKRRDRMIAYVRLDQVLDILNTENDGTEKCIMDWIEDGVIGCTYNHKDNEICLGSICKDCRLYQCTCYE